MKKTFLVVISVSLIMGLIIWGYGEDANGNKDKNKDKKIEVKEIPQDIQLFTPITDVSKLPEFVRPSIIWPDRQTIELNKVKLGFSDSIVITSTAKWLKKVMKPEWIPNDVTIRMLPLKESYLGTPLSPDGPYLDPKGEQLCDAIWLRYEIKDKYYIQIVSTPSVLDIFIKASRRDESHGDDNKDNDKEDIKEMLKKKAGKFLLEDDTIKLFSFDGKTKKEKIGWTTKPGSQWNTGKVESGLDWCATVMSWTNGEIVMFSIAKEDSTEPLMPSLLKHWFSQPPQTEDNKKK